MTTYIKYFPPQVKHFPVYSMQRKHVIVIGCIAGTVTITKDDQNYKLLFTRHLKVMNTLRSWIQL